MADLSHEQVYDLLKRLSSGSSDEPLKELFWGQLDYERVDDPLPHPNWPPDLHQKLTGPPLLFARAGADRSFHIIYTPLAEEGLSLTAERAIINCMLREHPYALFLFSNDSRTRWHFVNVRLADARDPQAAANQTPERRRLFRRITIGPDERLRTASERIALLDLARVKGGHDASPLAIQQQHDAAFDVEAVTRDFYKGYEKVFAGLEEKLSSKRPTAPGRTTTPCRCSTALCSSTSCSASVGWATI